MIIDNATVLKREKQFDGVLKQSWNAGAELVILQSDSFSTGLYFVLSGTVQLG